MTHRSPRRAAAGLLLLGAVIMNRPDPASAQDITTGIAPHPDLQALVAAERAFAAQTAREGIRDGFLAWLADDAVVFRPGPVPARPLYAARQPGGPLLAWEPAYAAVARGGDAGFTTGPWSLAAEPGAAPTAWGHFVTIWQRQPDGAWRWIADLGIAHPRPAGPAPRLAFPGDGRFSPPPAAGSDTVSFRQQVRAAEAAFAALAARDGAAAAYGAYADPALRVYREGSEPAVGSARSLAAVAAETGAMTCRPQAVGAARAGDLGWAWGEGSRAPAGGGEPERLAWLRIWRRDGTVWRIVLDVTLAVPAPTG